MLVHVIRVPKIEGGASAVIHGDAAQGWVIFLLEDDIKAPAAIALQGVLNAACVEILARHGMPDLERLLLAHV